MNKRFLLTPILLLIACSSFSQGVGVGTTTPDPSAALDISNSSKGLLLPRMNTAVINAIANPAKGLLVYDSLTAQLKVNIGTSAIPNWQPLAFGSGTGWNLSGNNGTNPGNQFIGTTDNQPLRFKVNNIRSGELHPLTGNVFWGLRAGQANTTGFSNVAIGTDALRFNTNLSNLVAIGDSALFNNRETQPLFEEGAFNTAIGSKALFGNTVGNSNTAVGYQTMFNNANGSFNTAMGTSALFKNLIGNDNTAFGWSSLFSNNLGSNNTAFGSSSLASNTTGTANTATGTNALASNKSSSNNTANGFESLFLNDQGFNNTAVGFQSLNLNSSGFDNTAMGTQALVANTTGALNTAIGAGSLITNKTGGSNTAVGFNALRNNVSGTENTVLGRDAAFNLTGNFSVAIGVEALKGTSGAEQNTAIGYKAGSGFSNGFNNIFIGANADAITNDLFNSIAIGQGATFSGSNSVRFGNSSTTTIGGFVGFSNLSDGRYKKNIEEAVKGLDFIMKLRPVTYQLDIAGLNKKLNVPTVDSTSSRSAITANENEKTIFSGFIAQEVEQAGKSIGYDFSGVDKPKNDNDMYGLRYAEFVVPLTKAVQEQQQMIDELKKQNADLQKRLLALEKK